MQSVLATCGRFLTKRGVKADRIGLRRTAEALFMIALALDSSLAAPRRELDKRMPKSPGQIGFLREVILGTTGQCNASCSHCPTNKITTEHVLRTPMPMPIFEEIVRGIVDMKLAITGQIAFGLHGDGLLDPFILDRAKLLKAELPDVPLGVNTNAAAFNPARHAPLVDYVDAFTIHCESLQEEVYDELMAPLRLKNVRSKHQQMIDAFPGKIRISVPVSRRNLGELPELKAAFLRMGASDVIFTPLSSRCAEDRSTFDKLALSPVRGDCRSWLLEYLVVNNDGTVLGCCDDFEQAEPIGNIARDGFAGTLTSLERRAFADMLDSGRHAEQQTCSRCYSDVLTADFPFDQIGADAAF